MMMFGKSVLFLLSSFLSSAVHAAPENDRIESLPLFGTPPTAQYSGYLNGTAGCNVDVNGECYIHYWFATAKGCCCSKKNDKPVLLWLNGGPGSSSVLGFLQELGPLLINATGGLMENPYSWTNVANVFVIESPVGVGFSYCTAQDEQGTVCQNTDKYTASTARAALVDLFQTKFPELAKNDFFITGESYAGVYIPTLAYEILTDPVASKVINLKGAAIGDPCTDNTAQQESMDALWYSHKYGLVDDAIFDTLWNKCNARIPNFYMEMQHTHQKMDVNYIMNKYLSSPPKHMKDDADCMVAFRKFLLSTSRALSQGWRDLFIDDYSLFAPVTDAEDQAMAAYMNRADVQQALHVYNVAPGLQEWPYPVGGFDYTKEYNACNEYAEPDALSMIDFYQKIVPKLDIVWVYNGDTDPCVTYEGTRTAVKRMGFPEVDGGSYRPWFYNHTAASLRTIVEKASMFGPDLLLQNTGAQFGGEVVNYEQNLAFLTVHGSGHMVPQFRPQAALHMITKMIHYQDLSPLFPSNQTLAEMSNAEFSKMMETWTESAKTVPYVV